MTKKTWVVVGSRTYEVLNLLRDRKVHKTNELPLPEKTRWWPTAQHEDRWAWFHKAMIRGLIRRVKEGSNPAKWVITYRGRAVLKAADANPYKGRTIDLGGLDTHDE